MQKSLIEGTTTKLPTTTKKKRSTFNLLDALMKSIREVIRLFPLFSRCFHTKHCQSREDSKADATRSGNDEFKRSDELVSDRQSDIYYYDGIRCAR